MNDTNGTGPKRLAVLAINERPDREDQTKTYTRWTKIGVGFMNRDGSINLFLDALPLGTNRLQVREDDRAPSPGPRRNGGGFETVEVRP
jgi:hypothetical protein